MNQLTERQKVQEEYKGYCLKMSPEYYNYENAKIDFK